MTRPKPPLSQANLPSHRWAHRPWLPRIDNELTTLPESFGSLKVGGGVYLPTYLMDDHNRGVRIMQLSHKWANDFWKKVIRPMKISFRPFAFVGEP